MRRRNWLLVGILLIVVVLAVLQTVLVEDRNDSSKSAREGRASEAADGTRSAAVAGSSPAPMSAPLPPAGAPVSGIFDALKRRADAGDGQAACRLAVELIHCGFAADSVSQGSLDRLQQNEESTAKEGMPLLADYAAAAQLRLLKATERCQGVTEAQRRMAGPYLHQAARSGINEAMVRFADGQAFGSMSIFGALQDPLFEQWKRDAPGFAHRALAQGEPAAIVMLMTAYSDDNSMFAGLVPDDLVAFRAQRLLIARLRGKTPVVAHGLDAEQERSAQTEAERMHREYFDSVVFPPERKFISALDFGATPESDAWPSRTCR